MQSTESINQKSKDIEFLDISKLENKSMKILTLYDNYTVMPDLKTDWGFAALLSVDDYNLLFDTGTDGEILLDNMAKLGVNPEDIDEVMISHDHHDHYGGLADFLAQNNQVKVYVLPAEIETKNVIKNSGAEIVEIDKPATIRKKIYTTGSLGTGIKEHSLIVEIDGGLVIITGCAHPGIVEIIKKTKELFNKEIYLVMGGFHLFRSDKAEVDGIIRDFKDLGVQNVAPCHCTGDEAIELFKQSYGDNFIQNGVGKLIEL